MQVKRLVSKWLSADVYSAVLRRNTVWAGSSILYHEFFYTLAITDLFKYPELGNQLKLRETQPACSDVSPFSANLKPYS